MSKFTINNPAFLSMAGNISRMSTNTFYVEAIEDNTTITFGAKEYVEVSTNDSNYELAPESVVLNSGDRLFIKVNTISSISSNMGNPFEVDKVFNVGGECPLIHYAIDEDGTLMEIYLLYVFANSNVVDASNLIIDIKSDSDYSLSPSFSKCTSLIAAPQLPATTMVEGCYSDMFRDCTSLTTAPELPATTLAERCYSSMFKGCTALTTAPELPATTLADECYVYMFQGCTSLTTAPELPATTLADKCYRYMFYECTSLTTAPELPATTLADKCYDAMFYNCELLAKIICLATDFSKNESFSSWVNGVSASGVFVKSPDANEWPGGASGIPYNWTVQDYAG